MHSRTVSVLVSRCIGSAAVRVSNVRACCVYVVAVHVTGWVYLGLWMLSVQHCWALDRWNRGLLLMAGKKGCQQPVCWLLTRMLRCVSCAVTLCGQFWLLAVDCRWNDDKLVVSKVLRCMGRNNLGMRKDWSIGH